MSYAGVEKREKNVEIAVLEVKVERLEIQVTDIARDVKCLLSVVNQTRGGWKVIMLVAGVAGTVGALIGKIVPFLR